MAVSSLDPLIVRAHHTALSVKDLEAATRFYVDLLGFEIEGRMDRRTDVAPVVGLPGAVIGWVMLVRGAYRIELFHYLQPEGDHRPVRQCDGGYTHIAFEVSNVDEAYLRATNHGWQAISPPTVLRGGATKVFYLRGPEGHVVEFIEVCPQSAGDSNQQATGGSAA